MAYTDPDAVRVVLTPDGDDTDAGSAAFLSDADLSAAIAEAQQEVDARLAGRYQVPFTDGSVPPLVVSITKAVAAYLATLTARRSDPLDPADPVALRYKRALSLLTDLGSGTAALEVGSTVEQTVPSIAYDDTGHLLTQYGYPPTAWTAPSFAYGD